jgi:hypothetical protein
MGLSGRWLTVGVVASLAMADLFGQAKTQAGETIRLTSQMDEVAVPAGRIWKIEGAEKLKDKGGGATADLYIDGEISTGPNRDLTLSGHFEISFNNKTSQQFPIWIHGGAKVRIGDSRQKLDVIEFFLEPWRKPVPRLDSLATLARHVGEYPCATGLFGARALQAALRAVLGDDYGAYLEHVQFSGCGAIAWQGPFLLMDVSQLHVGGYSSFILVNPKTSEMWLFWLPGTVSEKKWKMYGRKPVPDDVSKIVVDQLNSTWGHVARFSWREGSLVFGPPKAPLLPNRPLRPTSGAKIEVE